MILRDSHDPLLFRERDQIDRLILKALESARAPVRIAYILKKLGDEYSSNAVAGHIFHHLSDEIEIIMVAGRARYRLHNHIYKGPRLEHDNGLQAVETLATANR